MPDTEPEVEEEVEEKAKELLDEMNDELATAEPVYDVPEPGKFAKLVAEARNLTKVKVQGQLARVIGSGMLPDKQLWQTTRRHEVAGLALAKCQDVEVLTRQWPMVRWLRGRTLGNARNEMMMVMSWVLIGVIAEMIADDIDDVPEG